MSNLSPKKKNKETKQKPCRAGPQLGHLKLGDFDATHLNRHEAISTDRGSHPAIIETGAATGGWGADLIF